MSIVELKRCVYRVLCMYGLWSYTVFAQSLNVGSFDLNHYELSAGTSTALDISFTFSDIQGNILEIYFPIERTGLVIESIKKISATGSTDYWLTKDSALFAKNFPKTALILLRSGSIAIQIAGVIKGGDQIRIHAVISIPITNNMPEAAETQSDGIYMWASLSHQSYPDKISKFRSSKPILIKHQESDEE